MTDSQPSLQDRRDRALEQARNRLDGFPGYVGLLSYGAVDLDPRYLVVWVLLGVDPDELPRYHVPGDGRDAPAQPWLRGRIAAMRILVVACFKAEGWPDADSLTVGFESQTRVLAGGGWTYFK